MRPLLRLLAPAVLILILFNISIAQEKGLVINADSIDYQKERNLIEARGSVEAVYRKINIKAAHIVYNTKESKVVADGGFTLVKEGLILDGKSLVYFLKDEKGSADDITISSGTTWIKGSSVDINTEQIFIEDATFSSCNLMRPHYRISAKNMVFYPRSGWIVEYLGVFYLNELPVFPVPTYVFDTRDKRNNPAPLPEIGSDPTDGSYIIERVVWRLSSYSYGMAKFEYASKKGIGLGFESNYVANDNNEGSVRIDTLGSDGISGGVTHTFYFGDEVPREKERLQIYEVLQVPPRKKYDLTTEISYRERNNYERVTLLPKVTLRYIDVPFSFLNFNPKVELSLASVSEESTGLNLFEGSLKSSFDYLHPLTADSNILFGLDLQYNVYDSSSKWLYLLGRADIKKSFLNTLDLTAGYSHYFINDGASPFKHENYMYFPYDNLRFGAAYKFGISSVGVLFSYNLPLLTARDIDYNATIGMHCYDLSLTWRAMRGEFSLGVNLVSR